MLYYILYIYKLNALGFAGQRVFFAATQLSLCRMKSARDNSK